MLLVWAIYYSQERPRVEIESNIQQRVDEFVQTEQKKRKLVDAAIERATARMEELDQAVARGEEVDLEEYDRIAADLEKLTESILQEEPSNR